MKHKLFVTFSIHTAEVSPLAADSPMSKYAGADVSFNCDYLPLGHPLWEKTITFREN